VSLSAVCTKAAVWELAKSCAMYAMASWLMAPQAWATRIESESAAATREIGIFIVRFRVDGGGEERGKWEGLEGRREKRVIGT
jgi:hypothetical protein